MIAKVNGTVIVAEDVEAEVKAILSQSQQEVPPEQLQQMLPGIKQQAVESIINRNLLYEEVEKNNISVAPERVAEEIQNIASRFPSQDAFEEQLKTAGFSIEQMEKELELQYKVDTLIRNHINTKEIKVTDDEVLKFYESNPDSFQTPEQIRASHILLKTEPTDSQDIKTQKRLELAGILGRIEKGADFAQMAESHSDCPSKQKGGDLGHFGRGSMVKPFEDAAFELKPGELSDIVETQFGYHLIKLEEKSEAKTAQFDEVKSEITNHLIATQEQKEFQGFIMELRKEATIEYAEKQ